MKFHRVPLGYRDSCAHLLIPLNQCRLRELYLPWKCEEERYFPLYHFINSDMRMNDVNMQSRLSPSYWLMIDSKIV